MLGGRAGGRARRRESPALTLIRMAGEKAPWRETPAKGGRVDSPDIHSHMHTTRSRGDIDHDQQFNMQHKMCPQSSNYTQPTHHTFTLMTVF